MVDWDKITPIGSIPCSTTNSNQIDFNYHVGSEKWAALDKLKEDLVTNLGKSLIGKFKELGVNGVNSVGINY